MEIIVDVQIFKSQKESLDLLDCEGVFVIEKKERKGCNVFFVFGNIGSWKDDICRVNDAEHLTEDEFRGLELTDEQKALDFY